METKVTTHVVKGLVIALILIVISLIGQFLNINLETWFSWTSVLIFIAAIAVAVNIYGKQVNYNATFGNLFVHGFKTTAVVVCITFLFTVLSMYVLFPDMVDKIIAKGMEDAKRQGKITDEQIQQGGDMIRKITVITLLAGSLIGGLVMGAIGALLGAIFTKKNPQTPFQQTM